MIPAPNPHAVFARADLSIAYRNAEGRMTEVLKGVTLTLKPGGSLGIVGESGSGKSTLARALLGHLRPGSRFTGGRLDMLGTDMIGGDARATSAMRRPADAAWALLRLQDRLPRSGHRTGRSGPPSEMPRRLRRTQG